MKTQALTCSSKELLRVSDLIDGGRQLLCLLIPLPSQRVQVLVGGHVVAVLLHSQHCCHDLRGEVLDLAGQGMHSRRPF